MNRVWFEMSFWLSFGERPFSLRKTEFGLEDDRKTKWVRSSSFLIDSVDSEIGSAKDWFFSVAVNLNRACIILDVESSKVEKRRNLSLHAKCIHPFRTIKDWRQKRYRSTLSGSSVHAEFGSKRYVLRSISVSRSVFASPNPPTTRENLVKTSEIVEPNSNHGKTKAAIVQNCIPFWLFCTISTNLYRHPERKNVGGRRNSIHFCIFGSVRNHFSLLIIRTLRDVHLV